jgi:hypothetical protein
MDLIIESTGFLIGFVLPKTRIQIGHGDRADAAHRFVE